MTDARSLVSYIDGLLETGAIRDYAPNGLQVEGRGEVGRLMTGVTACQRLLEEAVRWRADALLVHHGWFWNNEPAELTGMKLRRVRTAVESSLNLLAYHLPLDVHAHYGNNAELARVLGLEVDGQVEAGGVPRLLWHGHLTEPLDASELAARVGERLERAPLHLGPADGRVETVAWCTGAGHDFIDAAAELGVDAYITGEAAERTTHTARERGLHFFAAGHHATERYGVQALGAHLADRFGLEHTFVDVDNPV